MKFLFILFIFCSNILANITIKDLDYFRKISDQNSESIIYNGTKYCNDFFSKGNSSSLNYKFKNFFMCKFSTTRNRFYVYMLAIEKKDSKSLKEFCREILDNWPEVFDHMDKKFQFEKKDYLSGFFVDNFFNQKVIDFSNNLSTDQRIISNEINNFIIQNRDKFTKDNLENNKIIQAEINKINKIYKKIISESDTNLDKLIKSLLNDIVRYKIFINDVKNFKSYSCNWMPGKGKIPYVKREKFSEFENI